MPKPITPFVGCDVFIVNEKEEILLVKRADNNMWALPGGCHDLGETPETCARRECFEETGYNVNITKLLGVFSSNCYEYINFPYKNDQFCHILFEAKILSGKPMASHETQEVGWFQQNRLPNLSDGHAKRIAYGFKTLSNPEIEPYYE